MKALFALSLACLSQLALAENKITLFVNLSPAGSFQAVSSKPKGNIIKRGEEFTADKISVNIESFKTGIELRDEHTWKHMNYTKHGGKATLTDVKGSGGKASGTLEMNAVKKPVSITYTVVGEDVKAKFSVKASDFGLAKAEYLGVGVDDKIDVEAIMPYKAK